jgi:hypothetical protein
VEKAAPAAVAGAAFMKWEREFLQATNNIPNHTATLGLRKLR